MTNILILIIGLYFIVFGSIISLTTGNRYIEALVFKWIPTFSGIFLIAYTLVKLGWVE